MSPLLELTDVSLRLSGQNILSGINLKLEHAEFHTLLGSNGAGKSSLAYLILGCEDFKPTFGQIRFEQKVINNLAIHERARLGITLAWQEPARFEGISVHAYLTVGAPKADPSALLEHVGLDPARYLSRQLDKTLSGGERKRIELAAVAAMQPKLAILDEPAAGIDLLSMEEIVRVIEAMNHAGTAVLLITHQEAVAAHAKRASQLCGGRIVFSGNTMEVIENYKSRRCAACDGETCNNA